MVRSFRDILRSADRLAVVFSMILLRLVVASVYHSETAGSYRLPAAGTNVLKNHVVCARCQRVGLTSGID